MGKTKEINRKWSQDLSLFKYIHTTVCETIREEALTFLSGIFILELGSFKVLEFWKQIFGDQTLSKIKFYLYYCNGFLKIIKKYNGVTIF